MVEMLGGNEERERKERVLRKEQREDYREKRKRQNDNLKRRA